MRGPLEWALEEAERAAKRGLRSVMIPTEVADRSYSEPEYARLWKTVEELGLIVAVRVGTDEPFMKTAARMGVGRAFVDTKICDATRDRGFNLGTGPSALPQAPLSAGRGRYRLGSVGTAVDGSLVVRSSSLDGTQSR